MNQMQINVYKLGFRDLLMHSMTRAIAKGENINNLCDIIYKKMIHIGNFPYHVAHNMIKEAKRQAIIYMSVNIEEYPHGKGDLTTGYLETVLNDIFKPLAEAGVSLDIY